MSYQRRPVKAPRLTGTMLDAVVRLAEGFPSGVLLRSKLLADIGVVEFRGLAAHETPTSYPLLPLPGESSLGGVDLDSMSKVEVGEPSAGAFSHAGVTDYAREYRQGGTTPLTVAGRLLEAVEMSERHRPALRLFISMNQADVLRQARESTERFERNEPLGPLDGVPVAVKDELDQVGHPTTVGTSFMAQGPVLQDATVVARLRAAGALLIGKTNMHEIGLGVTGLNLHHGTPRNPYDPNRFTGGSSSGSAAAVAAGICPLAVGADGGGSIRIPAGLCGLVGLKATFGRVSGVGSAPLCWSVGHVGPIAATARDAAFGYAVMAGPDSADPRTQRQPKVQLPKLGDEDLSDYRFGVYRAWMEDAEPAVVAAVEETIRGLKAAGATIVEVEIPELHVFKIAHMITIVSEMSASRMAGPKDGHTRHGRDVRLNMALAAGLTASDYVHAQRVRTRAIEVLSSLLEKVDGIVTPATGCTAPPIRADALVNGESDLVVLDRIMRFASLANLTGHPAISFPAGYDGLGLPIGCQVIGRPWSEHFLLQVAHVTEAFTKRLRPRWHTNPLEPRR